VHSDKKRWATPDVRSMDRAVFASWDRAKLMLVRDLVQRALELIEVSGAVPEVQSKVGTVLAEIDAALNDLRRKP
jgi:hypothetical protein